MPRAEPPGELDNFVVVVGEPAAAAPDPAARHELWIVYLCTTALPVTVSLRPQPDGRLDFAFDRTR